MPEMLCAGEIFFTAEMLCVGETFFTQQKMPEVLCAGEIFFTISILGGEDPLILQTTIKQSGDG